MAALFRSLTGYGQKKQTQARDSSAGGGSVPQAAPSGQSTRIAKVVKSLSGALQLVRRVTENPLFIKYH